MDGLTDEILSPRRTTRKAPDAVRDAADSIVPGDLILVDVSAYLYGGGMMWIEFDYDSPGSASVYPYKGKVPERGSGQWKASEILAWARPVALTVELARLDAKRELGLSFVA